MVGDRGAGHRLHPDAADHPLTLALRLDLDRQTHAAVRPLDGEIERAARIRLNTLHEPREIVHRLALDSDDAVAGPETRPRRRAVGDDRSYDRRHGRVPEVEAETRQQRAWLGEAARAARDAERRLAGRAIPASQVDLDRPLLHQLIEDRQHRGLARRSLATTDRHDFVPRREPGARRDGILGHLADHRLQCGNSHREEHPVGAHRKEKVGCGPGEEHQHPTPDGLAVVRLRQMLGRDGALALVEQLHVAAKRDRRERVLRAVRDPAPPQRPAKADREPHHADTEAASHPEMPELVHGHEHADGDEKREYVGEYRHVPATAALVIIDSASWRAQRSAASTS